MLKHIFKLLWNDKKRYSGIFIEQIFIFIILMLCVVSITTAVKKYNEPGLMDTDDVIMFGYMATNFESADLNDVSQSLDVVIANLKQLPYVTAITEGMELAPYMRGEQYSQSDSIAVDDAKVKVYIKFTDSQGAMVLKPDIEEGQWITQDKLDGGTAPAVITRQLAEKLNWAKALGRKIPLWGQEYTVVGVISGFKQSVFNESLPVIIVHGAPFRMAYYREVCARVTDKDAFSAAFSREFNRLINSDDVLPHYVDMSTAKGESMSSTTRDIAFQAIPTLFLLLFAFIGTFGAFSLYSQKRAREFALRLSLGSTKNQLISMVICESIIISSLASIPGLVMGLFIYEMTLLNVIAIGTTLVVMILFSIFSAWYPAYVTSKVSPADALRSE